MWEGEGRCGEWERHDGSGGGGGETIWWFIGGRMSMKVWVDITVLMNEGWVTSEMVLGSKKENGIKEELQ